MRGDLGEGIVETAVPSWVSHENLPLGVAYGDRIGMRASAAGDGYYAAYAGGVEGAGAEREHPPHTAPDGGVEFVDAEMVEEAELTPDHVLQS